ncbi:DUF3983 domain-containing protein [Bacillus tropicus]|nr:MULTISPECIES: DUF3983 domain-containing protein [Bacillus cereus group]MBE7145008.1 DUF3983 domain-containing protein [Bacillus paranthracis]MCC2340925.1 DUF3983 domain-containing protein [Bacillus tropicus]MCU5423202.1 DUF3983 domain-containing protein [Bacillus tropicus]MDA1791807.1 DUF3983 domain-containing protein [Bacillus cereus group sp. BY5-1LC]MDA1850265.1 DUF3983 domain-containing protein [Bacillus cereus]
MANRKKQKIKKYIKRRAKQFEKHSVDAAWRNIFIKRGVIK